MSISKDFLKNNGRKIAGLAGAAGALWLLFGGKKEDEIPDQEVFDEETAEDSDEASSEEE